MTNPEHLVVLVSRRAIVTLDDDTLVCTPVTLSLSQSTGKIVRIIPAVLPRSSFPPSATYVNYGNKFLLPGLVDAHVHLNEPGRTEWEGFDTGTRAAASGGVTTLVDMPLNSKPPTTTLAGFQEKLAASRGQLWVDVGFWGGILPGNVAELLPLIDAGVRGFKGFLIDSGVDEFPAVSPADVALAMECLRDTPTTLLFHAEMTRVSEPSPAPQGEVTSYKTFLDSRPPALEVCAVEEILSLAHLAPELALHIVHLSATECIPMLKKARANGVNITAETCFHYLGLTSEEITDGDTRHKCCPPIRSRENQDKLWAELTAQDSCIKTVVSDHSPCTPELKLLPESLQPQGDELATKGDSRDNRGDFLAAWGGISSVGLGLPIMHTAITARRELEAKAGGSSSSVPTLMDVVRLCCQATARQVGLGARKGGLRIGMDADVCVFDDGDAWTMGTSDMRWKNRCSPWEGRCFSGRVHETWLRGHKVFELGGANDGFVGGSPIGEPIVEKRTRR